MEKLHLIKREIKNVTEWTRRVVGDVDNKLWNEIPATIGTNIHWIMGHIVWDKYFHGIVSVFEPEKSFFEKTNILTYQRFYEKGTLPENVLSHKADFNQLSKTLRLVDEEIHKGLSELSDSCLEEATLVHNPIGNTKYDALMWCIKHQMWHIGQIAMIRRILS